MVPNKENQVNELKWVGEGTKRTLFLGFLPRISVDIRIRCPRTFTEKFPPPPPPNIAHGEIANKAAQKILGAVWFCRWYVEAIKVGYTLDENSPDKLYITGEIVLVDPTGGKINARQALEIGCRADWNGMTMELTGPEKSYDDIVRRLSRDLVHEVRKAVLERKGELEEHTQKLRRFLAEFAQHPDAVL